ncbi:ADP-ribosylation [Suillus lakei]|nr:ADP-ribosylation [Suillus lakei]
MSTSSFESLNLDEFSLENPVNRSAGRRSRLVYLSRDNAHFAEVEDLFNRGWRHGKKARPQIQGIFKILWPDGNLEPYLQYRKEVQAHVRARNKAGNEKLLFHGTNRACLLGESSRNVLLCGLKECYLCSILRASFDVKKCGSKNAFKRFGHGIYTSACSSSLFASLFLHRTEADDYSCNLSQDACLRTLLVNRVVVGRPYKRYRNAPDLVKPPDGFDSVTGEIGWDLNHEETVCYTNDAVRPAYLIVYGHKPKDSPKLSFKTLMSMIFKTPLVS